MYLCLFEVHLVISRSRLKKGLPSRHSTCADSQSVQLRHDRIHYFLNTDCGGRTSIVAALIEKLLQKWRDKFFLQSVPMYFPRTGAGENGNTSQAAAHRQVHRQAIARDQTAVALQIGKMLKQRR